MFTLLHVWALYAPIKRLQISGNCGTFQNFKATTQAQWIKEHLFLNSLCPFLASPSAPLSSQVRRIYIVHHFKFFRQLSEIKASII